MNESDPAHIERGMRALMESARTLMTCRTLADITSQILPIAMRTIGSADAGAFHVVDDKTGDLTCRVTDGFAQPADERQCQHDEGIEAIAFAGGMSTLYCDPAAIATLTGRYSYFITDHAGNMLAPQSMLVTPIMHGEHSRGVIVLASAGREFSARELELLQALADQVAICMDNVRLLEMQNHQVAQLQQELLDAEVRWKRDLIDEILAGKRIPDSKRSSRILGIEPDMPMVCLWMDIDRFGQYQRTRSMDEGSVQRLLQHLYQALNAIVLNHNSATSVSLKDDELIVFVPIPSGDAIAAQELTHHIAEHFQTWLGQNYPGMTVSIGISGVVRGIDAIIDALEDLQRATDLHQRNRSYGRIFFANHLGIDRLLLQFHDSKILMGYADSVLGRVEPDRGDKGGDNDLLKTLAAYFAHDRNIADTAQALHLHQNTVRYRIGRVRDIVETKDWLSIELAMRIYLLFQRV